MQKSIKVIISHQNQCDSSEIEKLINYLKESGFEVVSGAFSKDEFTQIIADSDSYVCVLEQDTHKSKEIAQEIITAVQHGKRIFAIFCPNVTLNITIPAGIDDFALGITEWNPSKLADGLSGKDIGFSDEHGQSKKTTRSTIPPACN